MHIPRNITGSFWKTEQIVPETETKKLNNKFSILKLKSVDSTGWYTQKNINVY